MVRQVANVTGACSSHPGFYWRIRLLTALDAVKEVCHVIDRAVAKAVFRQYWILFAGNAFAVNGEFSSVDFQRSLGPAELQSSVVDRRTHHAFVDNIESRIAE